MTERCAEIYKLSFECENPLSSIARATVYQQLPYFIELISLIIVLQVQIQQNEQKV
jgi:hypothetical protein